MSLSGSPRSSHRHQVGLLGPVCRCGRKLLRHQHRAKGEAPSGAAVVHARV